MTALPQHRMTASQFFAWVKTQPEIPDRCVVVDVPVSNDNWMAVSGKLVGYLEHPAIQHYVIIDLTQPLIIHHRRLRAEQWATQILSSGSLRLDPPGLDVDLSEVFETG